MGSENVTPENENLAKLKVIVEKLTTTDFNNAEEVKRIAAEAADDVLKRAEAAAEEIKNVAAKVADDVLKKTILIVGELNKIIVRK